MELTIEQALQQGVAAHKEGKLQEAERLYRAILQSQPAHPEVNHNLGVLAVSANKADVALPLFKIAFEENPKVEQFWLSYIDALIKEKQFENAKKILGKARMQGVSRKKLDSLASQLTTAIDTSSLSRERSNDLLEHYQNGRLDIAEKLSVAITKEFPRNQFAWKILGAIFGQSGRVGDALIANENAIRINPQDAEARNNLGNTLRALGRLEEAAVSYRKSIALKPYYAEAHSNLGLTLQELGRFEEAEGSCRQAIVIKPDFAGAHNSLGAAQQELGKFEEAEASYKQAILLKPDYAEAHNNLGATQQELGRLEEAEASYKQAILLKPDYPEPHGNLGFVLNSIGLTESALRHFKIKLDLERGEAPANLLHKSFRLISKAKLDHDIEQFEYLASSGYKVQKFHELARLYKTVLSEMNYPSHTDIVPLNDKHRSLLGDTYNRPIHIFEAPVLNETSLGDSLDVNKITEDYFEHEFGLTYFDNFLSPTSLKSLRQFLLGSTIWFDFFHTGGYMGAYLKDGLASPLILQIAEDLRNKFPKIFKNYALTQLWAYKYDSRASDKKNSFTGINVHADFAAVNVNFWITPASANLDPLSGGLVVYNVEAPIDWNFEDYNNNDHNKSHEKLQSSDQEKAIVPYNENRVVLFNSSLFHETDNIEFKEGYENRRINITMLFGSRGYKDLKSSL